MTLGFYDLKTVKNSLPTMRTSSSPGTVLENFAADFDTSA